MGVQYKYILRVAGAEPEEVARVLGRASSDDAGDWNLVLEEGPDDAPTPFLDVFFRILDGQFASLERIGVSRNDITVWFLYQYDEQCNLEFSAADMKRLGDAGISLCISCWQDPGREAERTTAPRGTALQVSIPDLSPALAGRECGEGSMREQRPAAARQDVASPPTPWFKSDFEEDGVRIVLVVPELELAWKQYEEFRDGVWEDARQNNDWRIENAGFTRELMLGEHAADSWKQLLVAWADDVGLYLVTTAEQQIVGMLQLRKKPSEKAVCYSRVLYRRQEHRGGVDPVRVFQVVEEWLRSSGIDEITTGTIKGGDAGRNHFKACGFVLTSNVGRKVLTAA